MKKAAVCNLTYTDCRSLLSCLLLFHLYRPLLITSAIIAFPLLRPSLLLLLCQGDLLRHRHFKPANQVEVNLYFLLSLSIQLMVCPVLDLRPQ